MYRNGAKHCAYMSGGEGKGMYRLGMPLSASNRKAEQPWIKQWRIYFSHITKTKQVLAIGLATQPHPRAKTLALFLLSILHRLGFAPMAISPWEQGSFCISRELVHFKAGRKGEWSRAKPSVPVVFYRELTYSPAHQHPLPTSHWLELGYVARNKGSWEIQECD